MLDSLQTNLGAGVYDPNPAQKALAQSTLASGTTLFNLLANPASAAPFLPVDTSAAGAGLASALSQVQANLSSLGIPSFNDSLALPSARLSPQDIENFITNPAGPVAALPFKDNKVSHLGDVEFGAVYTLVDHWDQNRRLGGARVALRGMVRLPTGLPERAIDFFDVGTGEGHGALGLGVTADLGAGRWGVRLAGDYTLRLSRSRTQRVSLPTQPITFANRLTNLQKDPGDITSLGARPFFRLTPALALTGSAQYWRRGADRISYQTAADSIGGVSAADMALDSKASATVIGGGISYASKSLRHPEAPGLPVEASWSYEVVVRATGGRVPQTKEAKVDIRFYWRVRD